MLGDNAVTDRCYRCPRSAIRADDRQRLVGDGASLASRVKDIFLAAGSGCVVAEKGSLTPVTPPQECGEGRRLGRRPGRGRCGNPLRQAAHHEKHRIQCVNAVRGEPGARPKRRGHPEVGFVEHRFHEAPPGQAGAFANRGQRFVEPAIVPPHRDQATRRGCPFQLQRLPVRGSDGLLDEQVFAVAQRNQTVFVVQLGTAEEIDDIDVRPRKSRAGVSGPAGKAELSLCGRGALGNEVADERE